MPSICLYSEFYHGLVQPGAGGLSRIGLGCCCRMGLIAGFYLNQAPGEKSPRGEENTSLLPRPSLCRGGGLVARSTHRRRALGFTLRTPNICSLSDPSFPQVLAQRPALSTSFLNCCTSDPLSLILPFSVFPYMHLLTYHIIDLVL